MDVNPGPVGFCGGRRWPLKRVLLSGALVLTAALFLLPAHLRPFNFPADDSYFYLQIARHIQAGDGSTFNGITRTNGYHPLWMLFCVAAFAVSRGASATAVHVVYAVQQALALLTVWILYRTARRTGQRHAAVALPVVAMYLLTGLYGSEAHINAFLVMCATWASVHLQLETDAGRERRWLMLAGVLAGGSMLARLDNIFFAASLGAFLVLGPVPGGSGRGAIATRIARGLVFGLPCALVVAPYLILNLVSFGHLVPISGSIKSTFPALVFRVDALSAVGKLTTAFAVASLLLVCFRVAPVVVRRTSAMLSIGVLVHAVYLVFLTDGATHWSWYYVVGVLNIGLTAGIFVAWGATLWRAAWWPGFVTYAARVVSVVILACGLARGWVRFHNPDAIAGSNTLVVHARKAETSWPLELAAWLKTHLPPGSRIMVFDFPGAIAFASGHDVLPVDGLINDFRYNEDILNMGIAAYLRQKNVTYWLGPTRQSKRLVRAGWYRIEPHDGALEIEVFAPLHRKSAGTFRVYDRDRVCLFQSVLKHPDTPRIGLWTIR